MFMQGWIKESHSSRFKDILHRIHTRYRYQTILLIHYKLINKSVLILVFESRILKWLDRLLLKSSLISTVSPLLRSLPSSSSTPSLLIRRLVSL